MFDQETGKVTFNEQEQAEIDRIVGERLSREKTKYTDYDDLAEIAKELEDFNYTGTPAEKKAAIKAYKEEIRKAAELEELEKQAKATGSDPDLLKEIKSLRDEITELKGEREANKKAEETKQQSEEAWKNQLKEFNEKYSDVDLDKLNSNEKFLKFCKGKTGTLTDIYEDFLDFIGDAEKEFVEKVKANSERSTSSGRGAGADGGSHGLSDDEKTFVDDHNKRYPKMKMTYKEYADRKRR
jgi:hypothetical protein